MKITAFVLILNIGCIMTSFAQTEDAGSSKKESNVDQYIGVQMNDLVRQVFNFNNSGTNTPIANPYLLTYNINFKKSGWGLRVGAGYNYTSTATNDGITDASTTLNDLSFRIGIEKQFWSNNRWSAGAGLDFVYNSNNDKTSTAVSSVGDTSTTVTKDVSSSYGGGPMAWLRYRISDHVLIGTEASFYYTTGVDKSTVDITASPGFDPNTGLPLPPETKETVSKPTTSNGTFSKPVVFYLIVRF